MLNKDILSLTNANVLAMRDQGLEYLWDYANHNSDKNDAVLSNLKKQQYPLEAHSQKIVKAFRDFVFSSNLQL